LSKEKELEKNKTSLFFGLDVHYTALAILHDEVSHSFSLLLFVSKKIIIIWWRRNICPGLKITAGQRTMTCQNKHLTGQTSFKN